MIQAVILGIYLKEMKSLSWGYVCVLSHLSCVWLFVTLWTLFWMWMVVLVGRIEPDTTEQLTWTELVALMVKNPLINAGDARNANVIPGPGESHGQRSLVGYGLWGLRVEYDWATNTFTFFPHQQHIRSYVIQLRVVLNCYCFWLYEKIKR